MGIFILRGSQQEGPWDEGRVMDALADGSLTGETMAWRDGEAEWRPLAEMFPDLAAPPPVATVREVETPKTPLLDLVTDAFVFPFRGSGWVTIVAGSIFFGVAGLVTGLVGLLLVLPFLLGQLFISGYLLCFYMDIIAGGASGGEYPPDWPGFSNFTDDIIFPFIKAVGALAISLLPAVVLVILAVRQSSLALLAAAAAAVVWTVFYYPVAMIGTVVFGNLRGALPQWVVPALVRTFPACLLLGFVNLILFAAPIFNGGLANGIPVLSRLFHTAVSLYCLMVQARFLGLFYARERAAFRWG
jgi:hypothetical protein